MCLMNTTKSLMDSFLFFLCLTWFLLPLCLSLTKESAAAVTKPGIPWAVGKIKCADRIISGQSGVIVSPLYPMQYPSHISCTWHIVGSVGETITITFHDLDIEESGSCLKPPCCVNNWIKIGPSANGTEKKYCGHNVMSYPDFVTDSGKAWVKFHISSVRNGGRGFKLFFSLGPRQETLCPSDSFKCATYGCVPKHMRCNGFPDCIDGSDEDFCSELCAPGKSCKTVFQCYESHKQCDGVINCPDFSDEMGCGFCSANETHCGDGTEQCYNPLTQRCNRILDCLNGADEKDCLHGCPGQIMCTSGNGCYSVDERCNGIAQCSDSSDEKNCGSDLCNYGRGGFLCGNGRCIRQIWKCDRTNDCGDGSDEHNCLRNSVLTAAVMGSLICALLLVIAVSCTCRLYALRNYENRVSNRENILSCMGQEFFFREPPPSYSASVVEHRQSLYVENVHYSACARRGRRRLRRARRMNGVRRPSISIVEGNGDQDVPPNSSIMNFHFPCLPVVPPLIGRVVNPSSLPQLHTSDNYPYVNTDVPAYANEQSMDATCQPLEIQDISSSCENSPKKTPARDKQQDVNCESPVNAESSFSELSITPEHEQNLSQNKVTDISHERVQRLDPQVSIAGDDNLPFHDDTAAVCMKELEPSADAQINFESHSYDDREQLLT